jgi:hypothetical protein
MENKYVDWICPNCEYWVGTKEDAVTKTCPDCGHAMVVVYEPLLVEGEATVEECYVNPKNPTHMEKYYLVADDKNATPTDVANAMCDGITPISAPHKQHFSNKDAALKDQIDKIIAMGDLPKPVMSRIKTLYNNAGSGWEYERILDIILDIDVHHRMHNKKERDKVIKKLENIEKEYPRKIKEVTNDRTFDMEGKND